jgi:hypothetical protein
MVSCMMPGLGDGPLGAILAGTLLASWWGGALLVTRLWLFPDWRWPEQISLAYALAMAGLTSTTVIFARQIGVGYHAASLYSLVLGLASCTAFMLGARPLARKTTRRHLGSTDLTWWGLLLIGNLPAITIALVYHTGDWSVHYWNAAAIQNDLLPLAYPTYPDLEVPYHYAIDLLAATWGRLVPIDLEWIFDGLTLAAWNACAILGARVVLEIQEMARSRALGYALAFSLLGGGLMWLMFPMADNVGAKIMESAGFPVALFKAGIWGHFTVMGGEIVNFPALHYFFNPPIAAGLPIGLAAIHLYAEWVRHRQRRHFFATLGCLGALANANVALFFVVGFAIGCVPLLGVGVSPSAGNGKAHSAVLRGPLLGTLGIGLGALGLGFAQGGFFAGWGESLTAPSVKLFSGLHVELAKRPLYYAASFGVPGLLGIGGAALVVRRRRPLEMLMVLVAAVGIAVPHVVWYSPTGIDNLKFLTIAALALGFLAAPTAEWIRGRLPLRVWRVALGLLVSTSVITPLLHVTARALVAPDYVLALQTGALNVRPGIQPLFRELWPAEFAAMRWLRNRMGERDLLLLLPEDDQVPYILALGGRFGAQTGYYAGYPHVVLPPSLWRSRRAWLVRARALEREALCEPEGLWVYAREGRLTGAARAKLRSAAARELLRPAYQSDEVGGRHLVFEACPWKGDPARSGHRR